MVTFKKVGTVLTATALSVGLLAPVVSASTLANERPETLPIQVAQTNAVVTKNDLIKRFRELFPNEFTNVAEKDFHMSTGHYYSGDDTLRYELSFSKKIDNRYEHGSVTFAGESLELEGFYYQPANYAEVLFPAKYSKEEAQKIADKFIKKFDKKTEYKLNSDSFGYYDFYSSLLTEPVQYHFMYNVTKSEVPLADQYISVAVLGDGTVTSFHKGQAKKGKFTYDDPSKKQNESDMAKRIRNAVTAQLSYMVDVNYQTGEQNVKLVYQPNSQVTRGVHALTGEWITVDGLSATLPKQQEVTPIVEQPLAPKQPGITAEQAQELATKLLATNQKGVKLNIHSIYETENENGKEVYSIDYMYEYKNGGTGTSLVIDKATGEVIQYHDIKNHLLEVDEDEDKAPALTQQQALEKAVAYIKEWIPSYASNYALPVNVEPYFSETDSYYFAFPRIVNGLTVIGDQIHVGISETGELQNLSVTAYDQIAWPVAEDILTKQEATTLLKDQLKVELQYVNLTNVENEQHYSLAYQPKFKESLFNYIDAKTGEWLYEATSKDTTTVEHPTAAEELNYLIRTGVLQVDDEFNPDAAITKGEALQVLMKSVTHMYYGFHNEEEVTESFTNISADHELYPVVTRALSIGLLNAEDKTFNVDAPLSREELAKWAVNLLKLNNAAQYSDIYQLDYSDASQVTKEMRGYVALASAMGLLEAENGEWKPKSDVTYAELAKMTLRLAHKINEQNINYW
ncbi:S-layer homology domain-containing protein [Lysinibacillus sp. LZ02]|uniref:S-layer homology domain-containing protein n=1 Tax=Lysinibacillus sp. LZ02 TaxID=3420668 RepID=UPI003D3687D6